MMEGVPDAVLLTKTWTISSAHCLTTLQERKKAWRKKMIAIKGPYTCSFVVQTRSGQGNQPVAFGENCEMGGFYSSTP